MTDQKKKKRPIDETSIGPTEKLGANNNIVDFTNPKSSHQLQVSDIEFVLEDGSIYVNACTLLKSCELFNRLILDNWEKLPRNKDNRIMFNLKELGIVRYRSAMLPFLYQTYGLFNEVRPAIEKLFDESNIFIFDDFLAFTGKVVCARLVSTLHICLVERKQCDFHIYPILRKYSNYGKLQVLNTSMGGDIITVEHSFFRNLVDGVLPGSNLSTFHRKIFGKLDLEYYYGNFCLNSAKGSKARNVALAYLFLFDTRLLLDNINLIDFNLWCVKIIMKLTLWAHIYKNSVMMEHILRHTAERKTLCSQ